MKITFDNTNTNLTTEKTMTVSEGQGTAKTASVNGVTLDLTGSRQSNQAYAEKSKSIEDIAQSAAGTDLQNQSNYMIVMSNCTSTEDFARLQEEGFHPGSTKIDTVVTIVDRIKAEMAKSGNVVKGYNDDLDNATLTEITGSKVYANAIAESFSKNDIPLTEENVKEAMGAFEKISELSGVGQEAKKYMVQNKLEPTLDNFYLAAFSVQNNEVVQGSGYYAEGTGSYYAKKADVFNWGNLQPQIEKVIEQAGLTVSDETLSDSMWMVEEGIPLTPENLANLAAIQEVNLPMSEGEIFQTIAAAIADGKEAVDASLTDSTNAMEKAVAIWEETQEMGEEAVAFVVENEQELTLSNLRNAGNASGAKGQADKEGQTGEESAEFVKAKRQLEEVRLQMTIQANYELIKSGYKIDTTELEQLVEDLKAVEVKNREAMFGSSLDAVNVYREKQYYDTLSKVAEMPSMPAAAVALFVGKEESFTLNQVHEAGSQLKSVYAKANQSYETMMTEPRKDLGDSIKKAFRNVDELLSEIDMDITEENRKAIRTLGYNRMALSDANIEAVITATREVNNVVWKMTPAATLQMLRDNKNPLEMNMAQLEAYLNEQGNQGATEQNNAAQNEKYSAYLYKLEHNQEISAEERSAYIGVARLLRQIEKSDGGAVGSLIKSGTEVTFSNLLSAVRTKKAGRVDVTADDHTGLTSEIVAKAESISSQINRFFEQRLEQLPGMEEATYEYAKEQLSDVQKMSQVADNVIEQLLEYEEPVTIDTILSASSLMNARGELFGKMSRKVTDKGSFDDAVLALQEAFSDEESTKSGYIDFSDKIGKLLEQEADSDGVTAIDLKEIALLQKQIGTVVRFSKEENYEIPVEIEGGYTSINLKVVHDKENAGKVTATMETERLGKLGASFHVLDGVISGYIAGEKDASDIGFEDIRSKFNDLLSVEGEKTGSISYIKTRDMDITHFEQNDSQGTESRVETKTLYTIAKAFIGAISR